MENLKEKTFNAVIWKLLGDIGAQLASLAVGIILARIVSPEEYGLLAIVMVFIGLSSAVIDGGLNVALLREQHADKNYYDTVFIFNILAAFLLLFILYLLAPFIASFYNEEKLVVILRVMGVSFIINAIGLVPNVILSKVLDFKKLAIISIPSVLISGAAGIAMAYLSYGIWALVVQSVLSNLIRTIFILFKSAYIPNPFNYHHEIFRKLFSFSYKLSLSGIVNWLFSNIYPLLIGKLYSPLDLSYYSRANSYKDLVASNISNTLMAVAGPSLSVIQNDTERLKRAFVLLTKQAMMINTFVMVLLMLLAEPLIIITITEKWLPTVPYLQILSAAAILYPLHLINLNLLLIRGKSTEFFKLEILKKILILLVVFLTYKFGMTVFVAGAILISVVAYFLNAHYTKTLIDYSTWEQITDIYRFIVIAVFAFIAAYFAGLWLKMLMLKIFVQTGVFTVIYFSMTYLFEKGTMLELKNLIISKFAFKSEN